MAFLYYQQKRFCIINSDQRPFSQSARQVVNKFATVLIFFICDEFEFVCSYIFLEVGLHFSAIKNISTTLYDICNIENYHSVNFKLYKCIIYIPWISWIKFQENGNEGIFEGILQRNTKMAKEFLPGHLRWGRNFLGRNSFCATSLIMSFDDSDW